MNILTVYISIEDAVLELVCLLANNWKDMNGDEKMIVISLRILNLPGLFAISRH